MADNVNHPAHYETGKFECIEVMLETQGVEYIELKEGHNYDETTVGEMAGSQTE